jgi:hypothetical protein
VRLLRDRPGGRCSNRRDGLSGSGDISSPPVLSRPISDGTPYEISIRHGHIAVKGPDGLARTCVLAGAAFLWIIVRSEPSPGSNLAVRPVTGASVRSRERKRGARVTDICSYVIARGKVKTLRLGG